MEKYQCLICGREMNESNKIQYIDYFCTQDDHHFSRRIKNNWPGRQMVKLRIRFLKKHERLALKIHYDEGYSEVWTTAKSPRFRINQIVIPNFENIERLKHKIRTILVFA